MATKYIGSLFYKCVNIFGLAIRHDGGHMKKIIRKINRVYKIFIGILISGIILRLATDFIMEQQDKRKNHDYNNLIQEEYYTDEALNEDNLFAYDDIYLTGSSVGLGISETEKNDSDEENPDNVKTEIESMSSAQIDFKAIKDIPVMEDKNVTNILLIGSDSRNTGERGRSDAMLLLSINRKQKTIILTSLLRDIYIDIPGKTANRLNAAYAYGGAELLMKTIEENFRIKVDGYVSVNFLSFLEVIDIIGGVRVNITEEELPVLNAHIRSLNKILNEDLNKDLIALPGKILLNGKQTLSYSRIRSLGTDFARTARQRNVLEQIFEKFKNLGLKEIITILNKVIPKVKTDLKKTEIIAHIINMPEYIGYEFKQWRIPIDGSYRNATIDEKSVLVIDFEKNIKEIADRIYKLEK